MSQSKHSANVAAACLALAIVQIVMLSSLYFELAPYPPQFVAIGGMGPFLAVSIASALAARDLLLRAETRSGYALAIAAAALALFSFGPQKYFDPTFSQAWIAVIGSQLAVVAIGTNVVFAARG